MHVMIKRHSLADGTMAGLRTKAQDVPTVMF